jgi:hypothetical protein
MTGLRIVLGNSSLADYQQGGGHWTIRIQYLLGMRALGHDPVLLELLWSTGDRNRDESLIASFFSRLQEYGLKECGALLFWPQHTKEQSIELARAYGKTMSQIQEIIKSADLLWNDCAMVRQPLLGMFKHRVLMDLDPGHLQVSALDVNVNMDYIYDHHSFFTIGKKMHDADCEVPSLGLPWQTCTPFVYLPMWSTAGVPGPECPFTSVTHWTWEELWLEDRILSVSKRQAYFRYVELPARTRRPFELAALIDPDKEVEDRAVLSSFGWKIVDPWKVAKSPADYQSYVLGSRAEISCPKPIFRELRTGWFSDRSVCYLASGRPVLAEDTGFSDYLPTGEGLLAFRDLEEAVDGVARIDSEYDKHMHAARKIAEEFFDSGRCLGKILAACG